MHEIVVKHCEIWQSYSEGMLRKAAMQQSDITDDEDGTCTFRIMLELWIFDDG